MWVYSGDYWEQRERKVAAFQEGKDISSLLRPPQILTLACDFPSYFPSSPDLTLPRGYLTLPEPDAANDTDTITDTTTDTATLTHTDEDLKDDTDTETELETEWVPDAKAGIISATTEEFESIVF